VPEWSVDGQPVRLYYRPVMTMHQRYRMDSKVDEGRIPTIVEGLIVRALDEQGRPLFAEADRHALMNHMDADVLMIIASKMATGSAQEPSPEDIEGN
jgi:hypothetical protein